MRRWFAGGVVLSTVVALGAAVGGARGAESAGEGDGKEATARRLHARAIVVDSHVDAPYALEKKWADVGERGATWRER